MEENNTFACNIFTDWEGPVVSQGLGLGLAVTRAPTVSREDSRPQAILKFQPCNSLDYRVRYEPQLTK